MEKIKNALNGGNNFGQAAKLDNGVALSHIEWEEVLKGDYVEEINFFKHNIWIPGIHHLMMEDGSVKVWYYNQTGTGYQTSWKFPANSTVATCGTTAEEVYAFLAETISLIKEIAAEKKAEKLAYALSVKAEAKKMGIRNNKISISALSQIIEWKKAGIEIDISKIKKALKYYAWSHLFNVIPTLERNCSYSLATTQEALRAFSEL